MTFVAALRDAHAVTVSHGMGDETCAAICRRTRLPFPVVREWLRLLKLPVKEPNQGSEDYYPAFVRETITAQEHI